MECPSCGKERTSAYCPDCGTQMPLLHEVTCQVCGHRHSGKFCPDCGASSAPPAPPPPLSYRPTSTASKVNEQFPQVQSEPSMPVAKAMPPKTKSKKRQYTFLIPIAVLLVLVIAICLAFPSVAYRYSLSKDTPTRNYVWQEGETAYSISATLQQPHLYTLPNGETIYAVSVLVENAGDTVVPVQRLSGSTWYPLSFSCEGSSLVFGRNRLSGGNSKSYAAIDLLLKEQYMQDSAYFFRNTYQYNFVDDVDYMWPGEKRIDLVQIMQALAEEPDNYSLLIKYAFLDPNVDQDSPDIEFASATYQKHEFTASQLDLLTSSVSPPVIPNNVVVISAEQLTAELQMNYEATADKYHEKLLYISGTLDKWNSYLSENGFAITMQDLLYPSTDSSGQYEDKYLRFEFRDCDWLYQEHKDAVDNMGFLLPPGITGVFVKGELRPDDSFDVYMVNCRFLK